MGAQVIIVGQYLGCGKFKNGGLFNLREIIKYKEKKNNYALPKFPMVIAPFALKYLAVTQHKE